jgi:antitoxin Phd
MKNRDRHDWQLQEAKARFSELFRRARDSGPQRVTRHGHAAVVVLPAEEYERLANAKAQTGSLAEFFARSPLAGSGLRLRRRRDYGRPSTL